MRLVVLPTGCDASLAVAPMAEALALAVPPLSIGEQTHCARFAAEARRREAEAAIRLAHWLAGQSGISSSAEVCREPSGRPFLRSVEGIVGLSISHCGSLVAALLSRRYMYIGIDVVSADARLPPEAVQRFTAGERNAIADLAAGPAGREATRLWARKEALAKASGRGLDAALATDVRPRIVAGYRLESPDFEEGVALAVALPAG